jgi:hypothetical protein
MRRSGDIRRHADRLIDFGFYRCRAARQRQAARRRAFRKAVTAMRQVVVAVIGAFRKPDAGRIGRTPELLP